MHWCCWYCWRAIKLFWGQILGILNFAVTPTTTATGKFNSPVKSLNLENTVVEKDFTSDVILEQTWNCWKATHNHQISYVWRWRDGARQAAPIRSVFKTELKQLLLISAHRSSLHIKAAQQQVQHQSSVQLSSCDLQPQEKEGTMLGTTLSLLLLLLGFCSAGNNNVREHLWCSNCPHLHETDFN